MSLHFISHLIKIRLVLVAINHTNYLPMGERTWEMYQQSSEEEARS
jgi:hypothetical protein